MEETYFVHRIRRTGGVWDKGIEVKDAGTSRENAEAACQSYHAFLGAYAYGKHAETDYCACYITDTAAYVLALLINGAGHTSSSTIRVYGR